VELFDLTAHLR